MLPTSFYGFMAWTRTILPLHSDSFLFSVLVFLSNKFWLLEKGAYYIAINFVCRFVSIPYNNLYIFFHCATSPSGPWPNYYRSFTITLRHTTPGRIPVDEWSARRRELWLTQHPQEIDVHASAGIRTRNPSMRAAAEPLITRRGHWGRQQFNYNFMKVGADTQAIFLFKWQTMSNTKVVVQRCKFNLVYFLNICVLLHVSLRARRNIFLQNYLKNIDMKPMRDFWALPKKLEAVGLRNSGR